MDTNSLLPERTYKMVFKSEFENGDVIRVVDDNYNFKVKRNSF